MTELTELRKAVEAADAEILHLIAKRQEIVRKIGTYKAEHGMTVRDAKVEDAVLSRNQILGERLGLDADCVAQITDLLVNHSVKEQIRLYALKRAPIATKFRKVTVLGADGGMGRFFCKALAEACTQLVELDERLRPVADADLKQAADSDVILIATPLRQTANVLRRLSAQGTKALVVEMCSIKSDIMADVKAWTDAGGKILSTHPMFGPAAPDLVGRIVLFDATNSGTAGQDFLNVLAHQGAQLVRIPIEEHDRLITYTLGLPHLINFVFGKIIEESTFSARQLMEITGTTFQRQYAVASQVIGQPTQLYRDIQATNPNTAQLITTFVEVLKGFSEVLASDASFDQWLSSVRDYFGRA